MLVINKSFNYQAAPYGVIAHIPAGTPIEPTTNLPERNKFWVKEWPGMSEEAKSWHRNYGFLVNSTQVTESC